MEPGVCLPTCVHYSYMHCHEHTGHKCRITTMAASYNVLYIGTGGGFLLTLNCSTMELYSSVHAYSGPVRSLLLISPPEQEGQVFSRLPSETGDEAGEPASPAQLEESITVTNSLRLDLKPMEPLPSEQSVLISFGRGYRGVVGDSENCPQDFILPSAGKKVNTFPSKPNQSEGHLLLWSTEVKEHFRPSSVFTRLESSPALFSPHHNYIH